MSQQSYKVVQLDDEGNWQTIKVCETYEDTDFEIDRLTDRFPHGIFDLLEVPQQVDLVI